MKGLVSFLKCLTVMDLSLAMKDVSRLAQSGSGFFPDQRLHCPTFSDGGAQFARGADARARGKIDGRRDRSADSARRKGLALRHLRSLGNRRLTTPDGSRRVDGPSILHWLSLRPSSHLRSP